MKYLIAASIILVTTAILFLIFAPRLFAENKNEFLTSEQRTQKEGRMCKHEFKKTRDEIMCENDAAFVQGCPHINLVAVNNFNDCTVIKQELDCKRNSLSVSCSNKAFIEYEDKKERYAMQKALPICKFNFSVI
uniref:Transmembrane protein n=1 Tax=Panagrolaimus sp. PS1159 TaxID=55785 RepID=A0AC35FJC7_9BILA